MARPKKLTMDFFIHDATASADRKIRLVSKKHGNDGYATYFRLLEALCQEQGMKLSLADTETGELLAEDFHLRDVQHLYKIIQYCADINLFDKQLWESERLVFSHGLHDRYAARLEERKSAAERQRRSRDAKAIQKKIDVFAEIVTCDNSVTTQLLHGCHSPEIRDQNTEDQKSEDQKSESRTQTQNPAFDEQGREGGEKVVGFLNSDPELEPIGQGTSTPLASSPKPLRDPTAAMFAPKPWRDAMNQLGSDFCEYVGNLFPGDSNKHACTKGRNHIINLERSGDPYDYEKLSGYWQDWLALQAEPKTEDGGGGSSGMDSLFALAKNIGRTGR
jgi:hypothetical protein